MKRNPLLAWWRQGVRTALLLPPRWVGLRATPAMLVLLVALPYAAAVLVERLFIVGPADFYAAALLSGWLGTALTAWVCWMLVPRSQVGDTFEQIGAAQLFAMLAALSMVVVVVAGFVLVPLFRSGEVKQGGEASDLTWAAWLAVTAWLLAAQLRLVWRAGPRRRAPKLAAAVVLAAAALAPALLQAPQHWYASAPGEGGEPRFKLTQELMEQQGEVLSRRLTEIGAGVAGRPEMFVITFAPYASERVFMRESALVASVMEERFAATGRSVQLVSHPDTLAQWPLATPLNLQRAVRRAAAQMNRDEDVLFIHLTSHGAQGGELAADFPPLSVDALTPQQLKAWLDEAGVRHRVVSVSACYSGSWIEPLADEGTLVMTAADATNTSYGCGRKSHLTFFGRAMFDEQLRRTFSFEQAHAAARLTIASREKEAGKTDGYSNPQIRVGVHIRHRLAAFESGRHLLGPGP